MADSPFIRLFMNLILCTFGAENGTLKGVISTTKNPHKMNLICKHIVTSQLGTNKCLFLAK